MTSKLLSIFGLKWNPFSPDVPMRALYVPPRIERFLWRVETQAREGGFVQMDGESGTGKSAALRILSAHLKTLRDITVGELTRPQAKLHDFYRELGHLFGVSLTPHNRWQGAKVLRERWLSHIDSSHCRPVLLVDEAQEMIHSVFGELRLLQSAHLDSKSILTVVLAGDARLVQKLQHPDLRPLQSRIRARLTLAPLTPDELADILAHMLAEAGNPALLTDPLKRAIVEHAAGNLRSLCNMGNELLLAGVERELDQLDEAVRARAIWQ